MTREQTYRALIAAAIAVTGFGATACSAKEGETGTQSPAVGPSGAMGSPTGATPAAPPRGMGAAAPGAAAAPGMAATGGSAAPAVPVPGTGGDVPPVTEGDGPPPPPVVPGPVEWSMFNYDLNNSRNNTSETKISPANVAQLMQKWQANLSSGVTSTPIVVGGQVYVGDHGGSLYAINAETGTVTWTARGLFQIRTGTPLVVEDIVYAAGGRTLYARKASDGTAIWQMALNNHANTMIDSSPMLIKDKIVVGVANYEVINSSGNYTGRGAVVGANLNGMEAWRFWPSKDDATSGAGVSVWSSAAGDVERNLVFIGTGQAYESPAGPHSDALMALNPDTGEVVWANQFHADDVYTDPGGCTAPRVRPNCDWDIGSSPNLFSVQGKDVVGVGSKGGLYRVVDRETGTQVIWERQLGMGSALGGMMAVSAVSQRAVYVPANNFRTDCDLYALDRETGENLWMLKLPAAVWGAISYANGVLYVATRDGILRAIDGEKGMELKNWDILADAAGGVSISDGVVYVSSGFTGLGTLARTGAKVTAFALP